MNPRILIVEDDLEMSRLLEQALGESGFDCLVAQNGKEGLNLANQVDLVLTDVMMPLMDGVTMVKQLRQSGNQLPIVFLTAKDRTEDIVLALQHGGDDYIMKPFRLEELLARIKANLRRARLTAPTLTWEDIELDTNNHLAKRAGRDLFLSNTEFSLLYCFLRSPGQTLSKAQLLKEVWQDDGFRDENIVELYINYLRKKTEAFGMNRVIHTIRRQGYVLAVDQP